MRLTWDDVGLRTYETGTSQGVVYPIDAKGEYSMGYSWSGLSGVTESPSGGEANKIWADDIKYLSLMSAEELGATIEAISYPKEFEACDGTAEISPGVVIGLQNRKAFGLCYKSVYGNDVEYNDYAYKLHLIYGAKAQPSEKGYKTINDSPEAITFSWTIETTPVPVSGYKPTASVVLDSSVIPKKAMKAIEDVLYGTEDTEPRLPLPDEVVRIINEASAAEGTE